MANFSESQIIKAMQQKQFCWRNVIADESVGKRSAYFSLWKVNKLMNLFKTDKSEGNQSWKGFCQKARVSRQIETMSDRENIDTNKENGINFEWKSMERLSSNDTKLKQGNRETREAVITRSQAVESCDMFPQITQTMKHTDLKLRNVVYVLIFYIIWFFCFCFFRWTVSDFIFDYGLRENENTL